MLTGCKFLSWKSFLRFLYYLKHVILFKCLPVHLSGALFLLQKGCVFLNTENKAVVARGEGGGQWVK